MASVKKILTTFAKPFLIAVLLLLVTLSPFGAQTAHAGFCDWAVTKSVCAPFATVFADILAIPMIVSAWILWLTGVLLNTVITYTVVELATHIDGISGINIAWATIRDLSNMVFIFVLLRVAIGTILGIEKSNWKDVLKNIVIAAVLINFSLLIPKVIIDASNIFTLGIYKQVVPESYTLGGGGMSNVIMKPLGLTTLYSNPLSQGSGLAAEESHDLTRIAIRSIMSSMFMITTAGVFLGVITMFIIRYITFIFLLVFSPIAVMSSVLPQLSSNSKKWWEQLTGQAMFAPVFMILLWVVLTIISSPGFLCSANGVNSAKLANIAAQELSSGTIAPGECTETGLVLNYIIVIGFVSAILGIAQKSSNQAGTEVQKFVGKYVGGSVAGGLGYAGRSTIGRFGRSVGDSERLKERAAQKGVRGFMARQALKSGNYAAKSSFDARGGKTFLGQDLKDLGLGGKAGGKDGYDKAREEWAKDQVKFAKTLGPSDAVKDAAKKAVDDAKAMDLPDNVLMAHAEHGKEFTERRNVEKNAEKDYKKTQAAFLKYQSDVALGNLQSDNAVEAQYEKELAAKKATLEEAQKTVTETKDKMKNEFIRKAEEESNRVNGVNDKDMKKQVIERLKRERVGVKTDQDAEAIIKKEGISTKAVKGTSETRRETYAQTVSSGTGLSRITDRVLFVKVKKKNIDAARAIRKDIKGKSTADEVMEKLKKEIEGDNPKPEEAPAAEPAAEGATPKKANFE